MELFNHAARKNKHAMPLAERMRPRTLEEVVGQTSLARLVRFSRARSCILVGPPGAGKTSVARLMAAHYSAEIAALPATAWSAKDFRQVVTRALEVLGQRGRPTILFVDEIHRLTTVQQDSLLPEVESGCLTLVGATTENVSWALAPALLSRCFVLNLTPLSEEALVAILRRANTDIERGLGSLTLTLSQATLHAIVKSAGGDARRALGILELVADEASACEQDPSEEMVEAIAREFFPLYRARQDLGVDLMSALIKSMRASDKDASVYYLARLLEGGTDPKVCLRRMIIFASEDVGLADSTQLVLATAALKAFEVTGMPEARLILAHTVLSLAHCPKSRSVYNAFEQAAALASSTSTLAVPHHLRQVSPLTRDARESKQSRRVNNNLPQGIGQHRFYCDEG